MNRIKLWVWVGALLIAGLVYSQTRVATDERAFLDELMASVLSPDSPPPLNLPLVPTNAVLESATYWSAQANDDSPPYPYNPVADLGLPLYSLGNNSILFDDRAVNYVAWNQVQATMRQIASGGMTMNSLEFPPDDEGTNENGGWTNSYVPIVYGTNDLWVELDAASLTNGTGNLLLHVPESLTNEVWDVWTATQFSGNPDNWIWIARTEAYQTNLFVLLPSGTEAYFRLGATNNDVDGDGILDSWMSQHFNHVTPWASDHTQATNDYDGDGVSNYDEFAAGTNPNDISYTAHVGYGQTASLNPTATLSVWNGVASYYAVMVDGTNFANPLWQPFTPNPQVPLPDADGRHQVWFALRGRVNATGWRGCAVTLDRVPPPFVLTGPVGDTTSKPVIQLTGYSTDAVWSVSCLLSNAAGIATNLTALATGREFGAATTNHFQVFDVPLTNGLNCLTLAVSDQAGNVSTTNLTFTFDTAGDTNAPALTPLWPRDHAKLGTDIFTLRAKLEDETASVSATVVGADGTTNQYQGSVERTGVVWVEDIALTTGTNLVMLTATDAATNASSTNLTLVRSGVSGTIDAPADLNAPFMTVSGTVSDGSYSVWVNGVPATVTNGNWSAANVPLPAGGSAVIAAALIPSGGNTSGGSGGDDPSELNPSDADGVEVSIAPEKPAEVKLVHGEWTRQEKELDVLVLGETLNYVTDYAWQWDEAAGGYAEVTWTQWEEDESQWRNGLRYWLEPDGAERFERWTNAPSYVIATNAFDLESYFGNGFSIKGPQAQGVWGQRDEDEFGQVYEESHSADVALEVRTHGNQNSSLIQMTASAQEKTGLGVNDWLAKTYDEVALQEFGPVTAEFTATALKPDGANIVTAVQAPGSYVASTTEAKAARLKLDSVTFSGPTGEYYSVLRDTNGIAYTDSGPHWTRSNSYPALYVSGKKVQTQLGFTVQREKFAEPVVVRGEASTNGTVLFHLLATNTIPANQTNWTVTAVADTALTSNRVDFLNKLKIKWSYKLTNSTTFEPLATSENQVYVTWKAPTTANLFHTVMDVACRNAATRTQESNIVAGIWSDFDEPVPGVKGADGTSMTYWGTFAIHPTNENNCFTTAELVKSGDGKCGAWANLFRDTLRVHGISSYGIKITSPYTIGLLPEDLAKYPDNSLDDSGFYINADLKGQNNDVPKDWFWNHSVVSVPGGNALAIYDPSYGKLSAGTNMTASQLMWETGALLKFFTRYTTTNEPSGYFWAFSGEHDTNLHVHFATPQP